MKTRVYVVDVGGETAPHLVRATYSHMAERHVIGQLVSSRVASKDDLVELMMKGVRVEDAAGDPDALFEIEEPGTETVPDDTFAR